MTPAVSVLMTVHNGQPYVESALRSVMEQSLRDIEIVVVDDASTDDTPQVLQKLATEDPRLRIDTAETNLGVGAASNRGLGLCRAEYVARMDADDLSDPTRLQTQKRYLETHSEVLLLGTSIHQIDAGGQHLRTSLRPRDAFATRWLARFQYPLNHPSTMFRRLGPDGTPLLYDATMRTTLDYDFCARVLERGEVACLPDVLLSYRVHGGSISGTKYRHQSEAAKAIAARVQAHDLPAPLHGALAAFNRAFFDFAPADPAQVFDGLRQVIAHDLKTHPDRRAWMLRQAAQLLATALKRSGQGKGQILRAFLGAGRDFLPPLALRLLETRQALPAGWRTDPDIWQTPPEASR